MPILKAKPKPRKKTTRTRKPALTAEQQRNADIFRLRGFYANAKTLPFNKLELGSILDCIDDALLRLGATTQTDHMKGKL